MTFQEMHDTMDLELDRFQSPYFDAIEKDNFLNQALDAWMTKASERAEKTQRYRDELGGLVIARPFNSPSILVSDLVRYRRLLGITADFDFQCGTQTIRRTVPVEPKNNDRFGVDLSSPFQIPNDQFPIYEETREVLGGRQIKILSRNAPIVVDVTYLMNPRTIDGASEPNESLIDEIPKQALREIVNLAVQFAMGSTGDARIQNTLLKNQQNG
jgi:hypothetical protein